jgi:hypothetical protein
MHRRYVVVVVALITAIVLSACSLSGNTHQSAPAGPTDHSRAQVIQMPSGFRNVAVKCVFLQGTWFAVASVSDGGNSDNKDGNTSIALDKTCRHYGG